jgi:hypothetical protein
MFKGENLVTAFATGNGMTISADMRRRSLVIELHQAYERPEDRVFKQPLNDAVLKARRSEILAAYWSMVRNWDEKGRPSPSRSHSAFPAWAGWALLIAQEYASWLICESMTVGPRIFMHSLLLGSGSLVQ